MLRTAATRPAASRAAVESLHPFASAYCCGPSSGIASGSSGASFASRSDVSTTQRSPSSSSLLVVALALRFPNELFTVIVVSLSSPAVDTWFTAKRVLPRTAPSIVTRASSAVEKDRARFAIASASEREIVAAPASRLLTRLMPSSPC